MKAAKVLIETINTIICTLFLLHVIQVGGS